MNKHTPRVVVYVDADGRHLQARTLTDADALGQSQLLVAYGGGKGMGLVVASESGAKGAGTWHHPDQPS